MDPSASVIRVDPALHPQIPPHLDGEHGDALWAVDGVPDAEVPVALGDDHIAAGHPLDEGAVAQQGGPR